MAGNRVGNLSSGRKPIRSKRAAELRAQGMALRQIGITMAAEERRAVPYRAESIAKVLREVSRRDREYAAYQAAEAVARPVEVPDGRS